MTFFIEAPTTFYMGRRFDPDTGRLIDDVVYYDSRDLVTHAVVVGMTGSGKTGLCITLLEEAVMDRVPAIVIDPKGDITNLMLTFPNLSPEEFLPWINPDDAQRTGLTPQEYAADVAQMWRDGLSSWGIGPQRLQEFKNNATFSIFTPGSDAGLPISIVDAMQPPVEGWMGREEQHRERISGIVTALLALTGMKVTTRDKEHVLMSNIIENAWMQGLPLTLGDIIVQVQNPPFNKLGVFDINSFFPEKERFKLAIELNNIIASPSFKTWLQGEPLDVRNLLYTREGKPRVSIFYIAHLNDVQRSFIITLLLESVLAWMRTLGGTSSLRALVYFDEVFGHFPPYPKNPPTKEPILRLLKQARAFGIGMVLATQNPGDLDYKGLSNAGTWFIGKLQTENDKRKVLDGLATASSANNPIDLGRLDKLLSTISPRVFVLNNIHDNGGPILMHTRWAMVYLAGPMTRNEVSQLMAPQKYNYPGGQIPQGYGQQQAYSAPPQNYPQQYAPPPASQPPPSLPGFSAFDMRETPAGVRGAPPPPPSLPGFDAPPVPPMSVPQAAPPGAPIPPAYGQPAFNPSGYQAPSNLGAPPIPPAYGGSQIGQFQAPPPPQFQQPSQSYAGVSVSPSASTLSQDAGLPPGFSYAPPSLTSDVVQFFLPANINLQQALSQWERTYHQQAFLNERALIAYRPFLLAQCQIRYMDRKYDINTIQTHAYHVFGVERTGLIHWDEHVALPVDRKQLIDKPYEQVLYGEVPSGLTDKKRTAGLEKEVVDYIYQTAHFMLLANETLGIYSRPGMLPVDFQAMVNQAAREGRDAEIDSITARFEKEFDRLEEQYQRESRNLESDQSALQDLRQESMATIGEAALSLLQGRTTYTLSRVARVRRYQTQAKESVEKNQEVLGELQREMNELQVRFEQEIAKLNDKWGRIAMNTSQRKITANKRDIHIDLFGIGWKPYYYVKLGGRPELLDAWQGQTVSPEYGQQVAVQNYYAQPQPSYPPQSYAPAPPAYGDNYMQQPPVSYPPQNYPPAAPAYGDAYAQPTPPAPAYPPPQQPPVYQQPPAAPPPPAYPPPPPAYPAQPPPPMPNNPQDDY